MQKKIFNIKANATAPFLIKEFHKIKNNVECDEEFIIKRKISFFSLHNDLFFHIFSLVFGKKFNILKKKLGLFSTNITIVKEKNQLKITNLNSYIFYSESNEKKMQENNKIVKNFYFKSKRLIDFKKILKNHHGVIIFSKINIDQNLLKKILDELENCESVYGLNAKTHDILFFCGFIEILKENQLFCRNVTFEQIFKDYLFYKDLYLFSSKKIYIQDNSNLILSEGITATKSIQLNYFDNQSKKFIDKIFHKSEPFLTEVTNNLEFRNIYKSIKKLPNLEKKLLRRNKNLHFSIKEKSNVNSNYIYEYLINYMKGDISLTSEDGMYILNYSNSLIDCDSAKNGWSFSIITDGRNPQNIEKFIDTVEIQNIKNYEIIICGPHSIKLNKNVRVLNKANWENDSRAWITKKKNDAILESKYENCFICHDRISLDKFWYQNLQIFHNIFDVLVFPVRKKIDIRYRVNDWERFISTFKNPNKYFAYPKSYNQHNSNMMIYGGAFAVKKSIYLNHPLDERLHWSESEDTLQSELYSYLGIDVEIARNSILLSSGDRIQGYHDGYLNLLLIKIFRYVVRGKIKSFISYLIKFIKRG